MRFIYITTAILLSALTIVMADETDQTSTALAQFNRAYTVLQKADSARDSNDITAAISAYKEAMQEYDKFAGKYPDWEPGVVKFRILYCNDQIESCMRKIDKMSKIAAKVPPSGEISADEPYPPPPAPAPRKPTRAEIANAVSEGLTLIEKGEADAARIILMEYLKIVPDDRNLRLTSAIAQCKSGNYSDAVFVLESLVADYPDDTSARIALSSAYLGNADVSKARQELNLALKANPSLKEAYYNLAQISMNTMPPDNVNASKYYRKWLELGGKPDKTMNHLAAGASKTNSVSSPTGTRSK